MSDPTQTQIEQAVEATNQPAPKLEFGFTIGVQEDGGVYVETLGSRKGLIQMLGLVKYAEYHFHQTLDAATGQGAGMLSHQVGTLTEMMKVLLNLLTQKKQQESKIIVPT